MKTKLKRKMPAPRNRYVAAAMFKKAGAHVNPEKAKRRAEKMQLNQDRDGSSRVEHPAFNRRARVRSSPVAPDRMTRALPKATTFSAVF